MWLIFLDEDLDFFSSLIIGANFKSMAYLLCLAGFPDNGPDMGTEIWKGIWVSEYCFSQLFVP